jgi:hypothetical protein
MVVVMEKVAWYVVRVIRVVRFIRVVRVRVIHVTPT